MPGVNRQAFQTIRGLDYTRVSLIPSSLSRTEIIRKVFVDQMVRIHQDQERSTEMSLSCHSQHLSPVIPDASLLSFPTPLSCHFQRLSPIIPDFSLLSFPTPLPPVIPDVRNRESIRHFLKHQQSLFTPPIVNGMMSLYTLTFR